MQLIILCGLTNLKQKNFIKELFDHNENLNMLSSALTSVSTKEKVDLAHTTKNLIELYRQNQDGLEKRNAESRLFHFEDNPEHLNDLNFGGLNYRVLFFYDAPERFIASNLEGRNNCAQALKQWNESAKTTLVKFIEQIGYALLFNAHQVSLNVGSFVSILEKQLQCEINSPEPRIIDEFKSNHNILNIEEAFSVLEASPETQNLFEQLESAAELLNKSCDSFIEYRKTQWVNEVILLSKSLVQQNEELAKNQSCTKQSDEIESLKQSNTALVSENELSLLQASQLQEELEVAHINLKQAQKNVNEFKSTKEKDDRALLVESSQKHAINEERKALTLENELIIQQVHRLQRELEVNCVELLQSQSEFKKLKLVKEEGDRALQNNLLKTEQFKKDNNTLIAEHELSVKQLNRLYNELKQVVADSISSKINSDHSESRISKLQSDFSELLNVNTDLSAENELSLLQTQQLQEELEVNQLGLKQAEKGFTELILCKEKVDRALLCESAKTLELSDKNKRLNAENELSLLQIRQLQEELEHYYMKLQQGSTYSPFLLTEHEYNVGLANCMQLLKAIS